MKNFSRHYLLLISFLWYYAEGMFTPLYSMFAENIGGDILSISSVYAVYCIVYGILYMVFGKIIDKTNSEDLTLFLGYLINTLTSFYLIFVDSLIELFIVEIILAIALALSTPSWNSLFTKDLQEGHYAESWAVNDGGAFIISGIALFIGGFIVEYGGWALLFGLMGCIELIATILIGLRVEKWQLRTKWDIFDFNN